MMESASSLKHRYSDSPTLFPKRLQVSGEIDDEFLNVPSQPLSNGKQNYLIIELLTEFKLQTTNKSDLVAITCGKAKERQENLNLPGPSSNILNSKLPQPIQVANNYNPMALDDSAITQEEKLANNASSNLKKRNLSELKDRALQVIAISDDELQKIQKELTNKAICADNQNKVIGLMAKSSRLYFEVCLNTPEPFKGLASEFIKNMR